MGFVAERFENADRIILFAKKRFYDKNLYEPLQDICNDFVGKKLWHKISAKRKLHAFYDKMMKAKKKNGNKDFSSEIVKDTLFLNALTGFEMILNNQVDNKTKVINDMIFPFVKKCEQAELFGGIEDGSRE